jgi:NADH-quinone oxidoreductase subunit J
VIGEQMLSTTAHGYILPFEVVSMLLLSAMIGCIVIAMKTPEQKAAEGQIISIGNKESPGPNEIITTLPEPLVTEEA